jgi:ATP-binding cassette subfamily B (MDR/TAP) protein 6
LAILRLPLTGLRLLLLPLLLVLVLNPVVRFQAADENTGLLAADEEAPARAANGYGTFDSDQDASTSRDPSVAPGTPQPPQKKPISKKLGEKKAEETQGLSWSAFWARIWKLRSHLWPSTSWRLQLYCWLCVALLGAGTLVFAYTPIMLGKFVDALSDIENGRRYESPWGWFAAWIALKAVQGGGFVGFLQRMLWVPVQQYADREMQMLLFNHLLNLSLKFHTKRNTGEVLKIIDRGSAINNLLQTMLFSAAPTIINIVVAVFIFLTLFGGWLAFVLVVVMTTYVVFSIVFTGYRTKLRREMIERDVKTRGIASDVLMNWESVKYFTAEARESRRFHDSVQSYQQTEYKVLFSFNVLNLIQSFIITIGLLAGSLIIADRIFKGTATVGNFVQFLQYLQQLYAPLDRLGTLYRQLNANATDAEKLFNLLGQEVEIKDAPDAKPLVVTDGVIEFDNVRFSYDGEVQALKGVSFRIGKGESMALVGESGSGKSTILRLLYRFYDIDSGTITIDGQDISKVTQKSLRHAIGIVPQDSVLWNDTIGANISYGKEEGAEDDEIMAAAKAAKLHDRIMTFPEEYDTVVGERGVRLSGGEKQRVSLARMFLKSPAILVLDEATSALDTETEREIQRSLAELAANRSSLSIAHRLSTIINSDQIVVMKNGAVIEHGTYHDLIEMGGQFAAM